MKEINPDNFDFNPFNLKENWALLTSGDKNKINTMTISWGTFGFLWNKNIVTIYVRPQRYTKKFIDKTGYFTLSFFDNKYKSELTRLGRVSGANVDKLKDSPLSPYINGNIVSFKEANIIIVAKTLYVSELKENDFLDSNIKNINYPNQDYSYQYIAEIEKILIK